MHLVCNELSFYPLAENSRSAEIRFTTLLKTFKAAKDKYGFIHIRFPIDYNKLQITTTETFHRWVATLNNHTLKNIIISICRAPFIDDLEQQELDLFYQSNYAVIGDNVPTDIAPFGLPVSYIKSLPAISFDSHLFWRNSKILVQKTNGNEDDNAVFTVHNICLDNDLETEDFIEWTNTSMTRLIINEDLLIRYLGFTKYQVSFSSEFITQFFDWKKRDGKMYKHLLLLMKDVQLHPFTGGMGQTENLKYRAKEASKRITQADRLSYTLENNIVTFIACKGHYEFH